MDVVTNLGNSGGVSPNTKGESTGTNLVKHVDSVAEGTGHVTFTLKVKFTSEESTNCEIREKADSSKKGHSGASSVSSIIEVTETHNTFIGVPARNAEDDLLV